jgi:hypothetical protein
VTVSSTYFHTENTVKKNHKIVQIVKLGLSKKAAVVSTFCLIGKICHNFLVPRMIQLASKTLMSIQTLDLHRVKVVKEQFEYSRAADRHGSFKRLLLSALAFQ